MFFSTSYYSFYNPFKQSQLAFLIQHNDTSKATDSSDHSPPEQMYLFSDMDLYAQPMQNPVMSLVIFLPIQLLLAASAICIQIRTLQMLKQEKSINNAIMTTQAKLHICYWPLYIATITVTDNMYPLSGLTTPMFCLVLQLCYYFACLSFMLYSFYAALLRYLCCLHTERVNNFGRDKVIKIVYYVFYLHVLLWSVFIIFTNVNYDHIPTFNNCYGNFPAVFLLEKSPLDMIRRHYCALQTGTGNRL